MTDQRGDRFVYRDEEYFLAGLSATGLFHPAQHGIMTNEAASTACYRGFFCNYLIADDRLFLDEVFVYVAEEITPDAATYVAPVLFGKELKRFIEYIWRADGEQAHWSHEHKVEGLREPIAFTGGMLLGHYYFWHMFDNFRDHSACEHCNVHELIFYQGRLIDEHDRSTAVQAFRDEYLSGSELEDSPAAWARLRRGLRKCVCLDYWGGG
jgi:hypothetical protein